MTVLNARHLNWPLKRLSLYDAVGHLEANVEQPFSFSWALQELKQNCQIHNPKPAAHVKNLLQESFQWGIYGQEEPLYFPGKQLFEQKSFKISLTAEEIQQTVSVFGDRLFPFLPYSAPQRKLQVTFDQEPVALIKYETSQDSLNQYFPLLPEDSIAYEPTDNFSTIISPHSARVVTEAADLKVFFEKTGFQAKDQLLIQVQDYFKLHIHIQRYSLKQQIQNRQQEVKLAKILEQIILSQAKGGQLNHPINALLNAYAELEFNHCLPNQLLSLESFLKEAKKLKVLCLCQEIFLCPQDYTEAQCINILHQQALVKDGRCETLDDILFSKNSDLDEQILEAYILDRWSFNKLDATLLQKELFEMYPADALSPRLKNIFSQLYLQKIKDLQLRCWPLINKPQQNWLRHQTLEVLESLQSIQLKLSQRQEILHSKLYHLKHLAHYFLFTLSHNLMHKELGHMVQYWQELKLDVQDLQSQILHSIPK